MDASTATSPKIIKHLSITVHEGPGGMIRTKLEFFGEFSHEERRAVYESISKPAPSSRIGKMSEKDLKRFWSHVEKSDGCWNWTGGKCKDGYGKINIGKLHRRSHRVSYELEHGPIRAGLFVCHKCDNPSCVRPDHLFLGTAKENAEDMARKGRKHEGDKHWSKISPHLINRGTKCGSSKFNEQQVLEIRERLKNGESQNGLAREFGVGQSAIYSIAHKKTWKHL